MMSTTKTKRLAVVSVVGAALVAGSAVVATGAAVATSAKPASCSQVTDDRWPGWVQGRPDGIDPHTTAATYMWHDGDGWHIRVTHHSTNRRTFSGQLLTSGEFAKVSAVHLEKSDQFQVSKDRHSITFLFKNYGRIDGVNFHTHCAPSIKFAFQSDGKTTPPNHIVIGKHNAHPKHNPFTINRHPAATTTTSSSTTSSSSSTTTTTM
jgi:hypothetical protein